MSCQRDGTNGRPRRSMTRAAASSPPPPPPPSPPPCTSRACAGAWDQPSTRRAVTAWVADARHGRCGGARQQAAIARPCFHCCARAASCPRAGAARAAPAVMRAAARIMFLKSCTVVGTWKASEQRTKRNSAHSTNTNSNCARGPRASDRALSDGQVTRKSGGWKHDDSWSWSRVQLDLHGGRRALDARWVARTR